MRAAARPYAEALFAAATARGEVGEVLRELQAVQRALEEVPAARTLLLHPGVRPQAAEAVLVRLTQGCRPLVARFLRLLADKGRMALFDDVLAALQARVDEAEGRVRAQVQTARPVDDELLATLARALGRRLGKQVDVSAEVRPELIGGARVLVGDRVLDASLAGQLAALRRRLVAAGS
jgi:F-type H+-transporting ATPase subunit delta